MNNIDITLELPDNYDPLNDQIYMSPYMLRYFKNKLEKMLDEILRKENDASHANMRKPHKETDRVDQGSVEELLFQDFILQEHEEGLKQEIIEALEKIKNGS